MAFPLGVTVGVKPVDFAVVGVKPVVMLAVGTLGMLIPRPTPPEELCRFGGKASFGEEALAGEATFSCAPRDAPAACFVGELGPTPNLAL